jgi:hypothetical protein
MNDREHPLQDLPAPDLWPRIEQGLQGLAEGPPPRGRRPATGRPGRRGLIAGVVAFIVFAGGASLAWLAFAGHVSRPGPGGPVGSPPPLPSASPITVQASFSGLPARCEATLLTPVVRPGESPVIRYRLTNLGARPLDYGHYLDFPSLTDPSGATVYTWGQQFAGTVPSQPAPGLTSTLPAGQSVQGALGHGPVMRWSGRLALHLTCPFVIGTESQHAMHVLTSPRLPPLPLHVFAPGPAPSPEVAITRAVTASAGLFASCRPGPGGAAATGKIVPPKVATPPKIIPAPMGARCLASVERHPGFDVVTLVFVSPPEAPLPSLGALDHPITLPNLPTVEVVRWIFVVTPWSTASAFGPHGNGKSAMPTVDYQFEKMHWISGGASCLGGTEYFGGGVSFPVSGNPC